jgi:hypothetical protein
VDISPDRKLFSSGSGAFCNWLIWSCYDELTFSISVRHSIVRFGDMHITYF